MTSTHHSSLNTKTKQKLKTKHSALRHRHSVPMPLSSRGGATVIPSRRCDTRGSHRAADAHVYALANARRASRLGRLREALAQVPVLTITRRGPASHVTVMLHSAAFLT